jgi:serine/threonine protein kinase
LFPQLFGYEIETLGDGTVEINYEFEYLEELRDEYGFISDLIDAGEDHVAIIFNSLLFGINTLYGLYTLHEVVGIVHSDISPSNIMYSPYYGSWKLNDFDQSMKIDSSLYTQRQAGTRDFIASESESTGIFTRASDIFSLGKVMIDSISPVINGRIFRLKDLDEEIEPDPQMCQFGRKIFNLFHLMTLLEPSERPTAIEGLIKFFEILDEFIEFSGIESELHGERLREARMCAELEKIKKQKKMEVELPIKPEEEKEKVKGMEFEIKRPRFSREEREAIVSEILPGPQ